MAVRVSKHVGGGGHVPSMPWYGIIIYLWTFKTTNDFKTYAWGIQLPPPPPHSYRIKGYITTFAPSPSPEPPISGIGNHWLLLKQKYFPGFSREIFPRQTPPKYPLSRGNGNTHATPLCIRGGGGGIAKAPWKQACAKFATPIFWRGPFRFYVLTLPLVDSFSFGIISHAFQDKCSNFSNSRSKVSGTVPSSLSITARGTISRSQLQKYIILKFQANANDGKDRNAWLSWSNVLFTFRYNVISLCEISFREMYCSQM